MLLDSLNMLNQNIHTSDKDLDFKWLWSIQCKIMSTTSTNKSTNSPRLDSIRSSTKCKISALLLARTWWLTLMLSAWALAAKLEIFEINSWNYNRLKFQIRISCYAFKPNINLSPEQKWPINQFDISYQNLQERVKIDKYLIIDIFLSKNQWKSLKIKNNIKLEEKTPTFYYSNF